MAKVSQSELDFLSKAREALERHPHISYFRGGSLIALRGYGDEINMFRLGGKVATFTDQITPLKR